MAGSAMRFVACAGVLAAGLLLGGAGTGIAVADEGGESSSAGSDAGSDVGATVAGSDGAGGGETGGSESASNDGPPASTVGNGREDIGSKPSDEAETKPDSGLPAPQFNQSLPIHYLRWPTPEEVAATGVSAYFGTVEVPVPSVTGLLSALSQPEPSPAPGPAFRGQEEAPVVDSAGGGGGGGVDPVAAAAAEPPVFSVPLVVAPRPFAIPAAARVAPVGAFAGAPPPIVGSQAAAAGAPTPVIRGTLAPAAGPAPAPTMTPMSGQATRLGYPRYMRNPTVGQLAAVAMPGVAGLMLFTFSGGVIGYRQANSVRFIRTQGAVRFLR